jgi:ketosteroid isomerase-like protein
LKANGVRAAPVSQRDYNLWGLTSPLPSDQPSGFAHHRDEVGKIPSMRKSKNPLSSPEDIEFAFYEALQQADIDRLMACWADEEDIVCVHPGGPRLIGPAAIRAAFEAVFANGGVKAQLEKVRRLDAGSTSVHSVIERVEVMGNDGPQTAWVVATNVYVKSLHGWRLIAHHASPGTRDEPVDVVTEPKVLH